MLLAKWYIIASEYAALNLTHLLHLKEKYFVEAFGRTKN